MAIVSISEAARLAGVGRATLYRRIDDGTISTVQNHDGSRGIDTSEILRVFGCLQATPETVGGRTVDLSRGQPETAGGATFARADAGVQGELQALKHQNQLLLANLNAARRALEEAKDREARLVEREERLLSMVEQSQRLLTDKTKTPASAPEGAMLQLADRIELLVARMETQDRETARMAQMADAYDPLMEELANEMRSLDTAAADVVSSPSPPPAVVVAAAPAPDAVSVPAAVPASAAAAVPAVPLVSASPAGAPGTLPMRKRDETPLPQASAAPEKKRPWWRLGL
jgi:hypothetical protein